jgi:hypothetical protein
MPIQLMSDLAIPVGAPLSGYRLVPGTERPLGLPVEAFLRLYAVDDSGTAKPIQTLSDVLALVDEVRSEEEAVELLRLETAPETHFLFPDSRYLDVRVCRTLERAGDLTERAAVAAGYQPSSSVAIGDGFDVFRDLVRLDAGSACVLVRRCEHLSRAGNYRYLSETPIAAINPSEILLPDYE